MWMLIVSVLQNTAYTENDSAFLDYLRYMKQWFQSMYDRQKPRFYVFNCLVDNI